MRIYARHLYRLAFTSGALLALSCAPSGAWAQQNNNNNNQDQDQVQAQEFNRADLATFDEFLDAHPEIAKTLRANPTLISDSTYLSEHAQLKAFLSAHAQIQQDISANPTKFMTGIRAYETTERDRGADNGVNRNTNPDRDRNGNPDLTRSEVTSMDQFLDSHQNIEAQLKANPSLIKNQDFLRAHPQLQSYLNQHPQVATEFAENPQNFMQRTNGYEGSPADQRADNNNSRPNANQDQDRSGANQDQNRNGNPDLTQGDVASMDRFLDAHQDIEKQLQANPSLITNQDFLRNHPQLQEYLNNHSQVQAEFAENPNQFMNRERRLETNPVERAGDVGPNGYPQVTQQDRASLDQFFDSHQSIEQQITANPSLVNNQQFLKNNPQFADFLKDHPQVKAAFQDNPSHFLYEEGRYEGSTADQRTDNGVNRTNPNRNAENRNTNPDLTRGEVTSMDRFLDSHQDVEKQLQANPSLINNVSYLSKHPALRAFLSSHAQVREEFTENPSLFMQREGQYENTEYRNGEARYYNGSRNMNQQDVATMDAYLDKHSSEAKDLQAYPARVNDSDYLSHHKDLESFFKKHPQVREEFTTNPSAFMGAESTFEADSEMDEFLDDHKKLAKDLDENPDRVKDNDYLNHHKDLKSFLEKNPGVNDQFEDNPRAFMDREKRFDTDRDFDVYLTKHRDVAKDLQKDPDRVKDEKYLHKHKDLKELMEKHPDLDQRAKMNPSGLMQEQTKFHEDYKNHQMHEKSKVEQRANVHPH